MDTAKEREVALKKARSFARSGNGNMAIYFLNRAGSFDYVSDLKKNNVLRILDKQGIKYES